MGEGSVSLRFPGIGLFGLTGGAWKKVTSPPISREGLVKVVMDDRRSFDDFRPAREVDRSWESGYGFVFVQSRSFEEIVKVERLGRYRGEPVRRLGDIVRGQITVGLESNDRETAARLGFGGDERFFGFDKTIDPAEFTDVVEEVTVMYRRGEEGDVDG